jgi:glycosyltransferase involved in cell wall biosynthesis
MRVLLFANDLMPFGSLPTSGGGLRCYQLMKGLQAHGVEVLASMPGFTYLAEQYADAIPEPQKELLWRWETQDEILRRVSPDVVLFASNWDHFGLTSNVDVPLVFDLHGSRLIETTMFGDPVSVDRKVNILRRADCLLCAGERQRSYFYGWLHQAGRFPEDEHFIRYVPVSLSPDLPRHAYPAADDPDAPRLVSGGGWYPWQNQARAVFVSCQEVTARDRGTVALYGTPHENPTSSPEERAIRDTYAEVLKLARRSRRVQPRGYVGRDQLIEIYSRASAAIEVMQYNLERELAFTTRTIEYLWCGLPVLYNNYGEVGEHISEYDAGWTVDPDSEEEIRGALDEMFSDPDLVRQKGLNAQRLVRDRFTWDRTIAPLLAFLANPGRAPRVEPTEAPRGELSRSPRPLPPAYLKPRGETASVPLTVPRTWIRQPFVVPDDHVRTIRVPASLGNRGHLRLVSRLELRITTPSGRVQARKRYGDGELDEGTALALSLPWHRKARPGERLFLELDIEGRDGGAEATPVTSVGVIRGLVRPRFPILVREGGPALALQMERRLTPLNRVRALASRAWGLARQGRTDLLGRALTRYTRRFWP